MVKKSLKCLCAILFFMIIAGGITALGQEDVMSAPADTSLVETVTECEPTASPATTKEAPTEAPTPAPTEAPTPTPTEAPTPTPTENIPAQLPEDEQIPPAETDAPGATEPPNAEPLPEATEEPGDGDAPQEDDPAPEEPSATESAPDEEMHYAAGSVSIRRVMPDIIHDGDLFRIEATLVGLDHVDYTVKWEYHDGRGWREMPDAQGLVIEMVASRESVNYLWRVKILPSQSDAT